MPRRKKKTKTHEEKTAENFFPVEAEDIERAVEKSIKQPLPTEDFTKKSIEVPTKTKDTSDIITVTESSSTTPIAIKTSVEKPYKKLTRKKREKVEILAITEKKKKPRKRRNKKKPAKSKKTSKVQKQYRPPKIKLKSDGYELIITEKPQAAMKIASALGSSVKRNFQGVPYYDVSRNGKQIIIGCAVGHLFTLNQNHSTNTNQIPTFDISWAPNHYVRKNDFSKKYFDLLLKLSKNASNLTVATDYDIEGEVIGLNIIRFVAGQKDAARMKFSTLTNKELNQAYENKSNVINWGQAIAGETRHYLDWFYGINLSRALMKAIKTTGSFKIMSIGRVQGPTLELIVKKEREIKAFRPLPYWQVFIKVKDSKGQEVELKHNKDIFDKNILKDFENLVGKTIQASTKKSQEFLKPNPPFNLTTLQTESYRLHGITPSNTLRAAQSLYLAGLISYPRTSSQKLPVSIGYKEILEKFSKELKVEHLTTKKEPIEGKKSDPAHPSIYPTTQSEKPILSGDEEKIYNLVVKRFLSLFCEDAIIDNKKITAQVELDNKEKALFAVRGSQIKKKSWLEIYPYKLKEQEIPDMNGQVEIVDSKIEEKETQPPKRYSPASIISELEKRNLGTKATRASILETLYNRGYIKEKSIEATPLGISLIETLEKHSPIIIDEALTRHFEEEMEKISQAEKDFKQKEDKVIDEAKNTITKISKDFEREEKEIGKELLRANQELHEQEKKENTLSQCPVCKEGNLAITYSKKTRRNFIACNAYPKCTNTYSLPPQGLIKKTKPLKQCRECNFPQLMSIRKGKRPWIFCFNPECPTNKERIEAYRVKKEAETKKN
ncbi:MAG: DNA topoisomerase I [Candidatus Nanoarchaeia archaeon]